MYIYNLEFFFHFSKSNILLAWREYIVGSAIYSPLVFTEGRGYSNCRWAFDR